MGRASLLCDDIWFFCLFIFSPWLLPLKSQDGPEKDKPKFLLTPRTATQGWLGFPEQWFCKQSCLCSPQREGVESLSVSEYKQDPEAPTERVWKPLFPLPYSSPALVSGKFCGTPFNWSGRGCYGNSHFRQSEVTLGLSIAVGGEGSLTWGLSPSPWNLTLFLGT